MFWNPGQLLLSQDDIEDDYGVLIKLINANKNTTITKLSDYSYFDVQMYLENTVVVVDEIIDNLVKVRR